jgi:hypothetical protein
MDNLFVAFWVMWSTYSFKTDADNSPRQSYNAIEQDLYISEEECDKAKEPVEQREMKRDNLYSSYKIDCTRVMLPYSKFKQLKLDDSK